MPVRVVCSYIFFSESWEWEMALKKKKKIKKMKKNACRNSRVTLDGCVMIVSTFHPTSCALSQPFIRRCVGIIIIFMVCVHNIKRPPHMLYTCIRLKCKGITACLSLLGVSDVSFPNALTFRRLQKSCLYGTLWVYRRRNWVSRSVDHSLLCRYNIVQQVNPNSCRRNSSIFYY